MNSSSTAALQKPETKYTYEFRFIPTLPTKEAWTSKEFDTFREPKLLFKAMRTNEYKYESQYSGLIRFKAGFFSERIDPKTLDKYGKQKPRYNNPRWWEEGRSSCVKGCCRTLPEGCVIAARKPDPQPIYKPTYQNYESAKDLETQFKEIANKSSIDMITISGKGWFYVNATPI
jgi:hypothetical protein